MSPSAICLSEFTHLVRMNPCSNRCLIAVTSMAVRLSSQSGSELRIHSSPEHRTSSCAASVITGTLVLSLKKMIHITQAFPRVQKQSVKHLGKFQRVRCFHVGLSLSSKRAAHNTFALVTLPVHRSRRCFKTIQDSFVSSDDQTTTL